MKNKHPTIKQCVVVSDLHCGCRLAICGNEPIPLDDGGTYQPSRFQLVLAKWWDEFWYKWVPEATHNEPYCVVLNGDVIDGVHHNSTTQISQNIQDQAEIAVRLLDPIVGLCQGRFYMVRGTEAHVGKSAVDEESVAKRLGAIPNSEGQHARWDLWLALGDALVHFLHHVGTTSSSSHESSAVNAELTAEFLEAARWNLRAPDVIVRSHRHRHIEVRIPTHKGFATATVTPSWQIKTPFAWRLAGSRLAPPQIGGLVIRRGDRAIYTDPWIKHLLQSETTTP